MRRQTPAALRTSNLPWLTGAGPFCTCHPIQPWRNLGAGRSRLLVTRLCAWRASWLLCSRSAWAAAESCCSAISSATRDDAQSQSTFIRIAPIPTSSRFSSMNTITPRRTHTRAWCFLRITLISLASCGSVFPPRRQTAWGRMPVPYAARPGVQSSALPREEEQRQ